MTPTPAFDPAALRETTAALRMELVCIAGSIVFGLPGRGEQVALRQGDRLDLPARTLAAVPVRRPAGEW
jgi:hypothetical protein